MRGDEGSQLRNISHKHADGLLSLDERLAGDVDVSVNDVPSSVQFERQLEFRLLRKSLVDVEVGVVNVHGSAFQMVVGFILISVF